MATHFQKTHSCILALLHSPHFRIRALPLHRGIPLLAPASLASNERSDIVHTLVLGACLFAHFSQYPPDRPWNEDTQTAIQRDSA